MGYDTYFSLEVDNDERYNLGICQALSKIIDDEIFVFYSAEHKYFDYNDEFFNEALDWDDWYSDMVQISKQFPDCIFHLEGHGEDFEDWWEAHFKNGHGYQQMAIIPPFDPAKLKMEDTCLGIEEVI